MPQTKTAMHFAMPMLRMLQPTWTKTSEIISTHNTTSSKSKTPPSNKSAKSRLIGEERGERIAQGNWSKFETILLHEVLSTTAHHADIKKKAKLYNDVQEYSKAEYCMVELPSNVVLQKKN